MKRNIIRIDREKCTGCGICVPDCPEGAIQMIDGKAALVSDLFCDGLGACIKQCPEGAISIEEREAEPYDELKVMKNIVKLGEAVDYLRKYGFSVPDLNDENKPCCPGSAIHDRRNTPKNSNNDSAGDGAAVNSELRQWPVQLKLLNANAPFFKNADIVIAADCVPFSYGNFHRRFLKDKILIILCPKLDPYQEEYIDKLSNIIKNNDIKSITAVRMQVPCCGGINYYIEKALEKAGRIMSIREYVISLDGNII